MQKIIDKLINNSVRTFEELKTKIIDNPALIVESDKGKINCLFLIYKANTPDEMRKLYTYSNNKLMPCRVKQFIKKVEIGEYKIIYEVA